MFKAVRNSVKSQIITVTSLCLIVVLMGVFFVTQSYSAAIDAININKNNVEEQVWKVGINKDSYKETEGSNPATSTSISSNAVISSVTLNNPGEFNEYTIAVENNGNMEAVLKNINIDGLNDRVTATIKVNAEEYQNNEVVLAPNSKNYLTIRVTYNENEMVEPLWLKLVTTFEIEQK